MPRFCSMLLSFLLFAAILGCGGAGDKGKNKDKDIPKPAELPAAG